MLPLALRTNRVAPRESLAGLPRRTGEDRRINRGEAPQVFAQVSWRKYEFGVVQAFIITLHNGQFELLLPSREMALDDSMCHVTWDMLQSSKRLSMETSPESSFKPSGHLNSIR